MRNKFYRIGSWKPPKVLWDLFSIKSCSEVNDVKTMNVQCGIGHGEGGGRGVWSKKFGYENAIKHERGDPLRFSYNTKYPLKKFGQNPMDPPLDFQLLCIYGSMWYWTWKNPISFVSSRRGKCKKKHDFLTITWFSILATFLRRSLTLSKTIKLIKK